MELSAEQEAYANQDWVNQESGHLLYEHRMPPEHTNKLTFLEWAESHGSGLSWPDMLNDYRLGSAEWAIISQKVCLTDKQRENLYSHFWENCSLSEIAQRKKTSIQNVQQSIAGALKKVEHGLIFRDIMKTQLK